MRRLGVLVLVLAMGGALPASAEGWERESGWWIRLVSWWTNQLSPALELEREVASDGTYVNSSGRAGTSTTPESPLSESDDSYGMDPNGR